MTKTKITPYDIVDYLITPEDYAAYLDACIAESQGDPAFIAKAIGDIARAKGMGDLARETGMGRESLYKALSGERNPEFGIILKVLKALGLELHTTVAAS